MNKSERVTGMSVDRRPAPQATPKNGGAGETRNIFLLINAKKIASEPLLRAIGANAQSAGRMTVVESRSQSHLRRAIASGLRSKVDLIVAAGGDGTLNAVVDAVLHSKARRPPALALLPFGTANDFAKSCGIPLKDPAAAWRLALCGAPEPIDVGEVNGRFFINAATGGFGSRVTNETPKPLKRRLGSLAYVLTGITSLRGFRAKRISVRAAGFSWSGRAVAIAVGNGRQAGGRFRFAPRARLNDGRLDGFILPEMPVRDLARAVRELRRGDPDLHASHGVRFSASSLRVAAPSGLQMNLDGEPLRGDRFAFRIRPRAVRFCLPPAHTEV